MKQFGAALRKPSARVLASLVFGSTLAVGAVVVGAPTASAEGINMDLACQYTHGNDAWKGELSYPTQGAYGWRCDDRRTIFTDEQGSVNIYAYCINVLGGSSTSNVLSDPYSWQCN